MKSMAAVALIVATTALPVCAQRSMARGGFAGQGVFVAHGGVSAPTASRFAAPGRPFAFTPPPTLNRPPGINAAVRPGSFNRYPVRTPYLPVYRRRGVYVSTVPGIYPYYTNSGYPWLFDDGGDSQPYPNNEQAPPPDYGSSPSPSPDYGPAPSPEYGTAPYPYYAPVPPAQSQGWPSPVPGYTYYYVVPTAAPPAEEAPVTLIFRNGRAPEQIHNYMLTRTTLTVFDQPYRQIPLDQIDIAATEETNRKAGVDFRIPGSSR